MTISLYKPKQKAGINELAPVVDTLNYKSLTAHLNTERKQAAYLLWID